MTLVNFDSFQHSEEIELLWPYRHELLALIERNQSPLNFFNRTSENNESSYTEKQAEAIDELVRYFGFVEHKHKSFQGPTSDLNTSRLYEKGTSAELISSLHAKSPFIHITTYDEERCLEIIRRTISVLDPDMSVNSWNCLDGFDSSLIERVAPFIATIPNIPEHFSEEEEEHAKSFAEAEMRAKLNAVSTDVQGALKLLKMPMQSKECIVFFDSQLFIHDGNDKVFSNNTPNWRAIKAAFQEIDANGHKIVFVSDSPCPSALSGYVTPVDLRLPSRNELRELIATELHPEDIPVESALQLADAAVGLSAFTVKKDLEKLRSQSIRTHDQLRQSLLTKKRKALQDSGLLNEVHLNNFESKIGGLDSAKSWSTKRKDLFLAPAFAAENGITPPPRGILLVGVTGTGKSLLSKVVAKDWDIPLIQMDFGQIHDKWVGSSEQRFQRSLRLIESISPCILWIDEIEKQLGGIENSGGTSSRLFGSLLFWMQEHQFPIFIIATANDVDRLPPELLRPGRFDERFFIGLPGQKAREEILRIHLSKCKIEIDNSEIQELSHITHGLTGAEIEALARNTKINHLHSGKPISIESFEAVLMESKPVVRSLGKRLDPIWDWLEQGRFRLASSEKDTLTKAEVASLINPNRYFTMFCSLDHIDGLEDEAKRAEKLLFLEMYKRPTLCFIKLDDPEWVYGQCNVPIFESDEASLGGRGRNEEFKPFKFCERFDDLILSDVMPTLIEGHGIRSIVFDDKENFDRFYAHEQLLEYQALFEYREISKK